MKLRSSLFAIAMASFALIGTAVGCSSSTTQQQPPGPAACDPTQCATKNECLSDGKETKCRLPCNAQAECPFNYTCSFNPASKNFCTKNTVEIEKKPTGQWGTACLPNEGFDNNPKCDTSGAKKFACYAKDPTDANAYCTLYDCQADSDCAGGYWCATINVAPNATTAKRSLVDTRTVCLKREYCASCKGDIDCPAVGGEPQYCVQDDNGAGFCTRACSNDTNCALDASCQPWGKDGKTVCAPRAGVCRGDGKLCAPCMSDADCPNGYCVSADYSTEKFCTVQSQAPCSDSSRGDCPKNVEGVPNAGISCIGSNTFPEAPKDSCVGLVQFGTDSQTGKPTYALGCWTIARK
jgi:hypothetical protein